jgi:DNA-binding transcriptional MerR regulator
MVTPRKAADMPNIIDFSEDPKYTIKTVASQTGIRPVTLRAWERRHEVLTPYRSDNRYRLYSDRDIATLRWLKNRVDSGISISNAVSELRALATKDLWPEAIPTVPSRLSGSYAKPPAQYANRLSQALMRHDEMAAADLLREAHAIYDLMAIFSEILVPTLVEIGDAWYNGRIRITTEHFASSFLRGKLLSLLQAYPSRRGTPYILLGCAPTEQHELGSLMLAVLLRSHGFRVEFLGPDIPIDDLVDYATYEHPAMIVLSATSALSALEMKHMQEKLRKVRPAPLFGYGGRAFDLDTTLPGQIPGNYLGNTLEKAFLTIKDLLARQGKKTAG